MSGKVRLKVTTTVVCRNLDFARALSDSLSYMTEKRIEGCTDKVLDHDSYKVEVDLEPL